MRTDAREQQCDAQKHVQPCSRRSWRRPTSWRRLMIQMGPQPEKVLHDEQTHQCKANDLFRNNVKAQRVISTHDSQSRRAYLVRKKTLAAAPLGLYGHDDGCEREQCHRSRQVALPTFRACQRLFPGEMRHSGRTHQNARGTVLW